MPCPEKISRSRRWLLRALLTAVLVAMSSSWIVTRAHAQTGNPNFWFLNETGYQVDRVYVSAHGDSEWGEDLLGDRSVLAHGLGVLITFPSQSQCNLDFKLVFHDGHKETYTDGYNTCNLHAVIFHKGSLNGY